MVLFFKKITFVDLRKQKRNGDTEEHSNGRNNDVVKQLYPYRKRQILTRFEEAGLDLYKRNSRTNDQSADQPEEDNQQSGKEISQSQICSVEAQGNQCFGLLFLVKLKDRNSTCQIESRNKDHQAKD